MNSTGTIRCSICGSANVQLFFELNDIPVHCNVLHATREEALNAPRGNMNLSFCYDCGHLYNHAFNPTVMLYTQAYENSLHFSPRFQRYAENLAKDLIDRYDLHNQTIIEVGCGKGDFLKLMCDLGENRGVGFDESYQPDVIEGGTSERFTVVQDFYSEKYSHYNADFICCRHVLEHIQSPVNFINNIRESIGSRIDCAVYFEVPNALYTLKDLGIWDLIYEHCSYFTANSLSQLFTSCRFEVARLVEKYDGQFLGIELKPVERFSRIAPFDKQSDTGVSRYKPLEQPPLNEVDTQAIVQFVKSFGENYRTKVEAWKNNFEQFKREGKRVVVWGSGSKGVTFLNVLKHYANVEYVVDINPRKQGMYVAGTGQQIVAPEFLHDYKPDVVIIMNPIYKEEIRGIAAQIGLAPELMVA